MLGNSPAFSGFSVSDLDAARTFYVDVLGLTLVDNPMGMLEFEFPGGGHVIAYPKGDGHVPATFTVLNFPVDDIDAAVDGLVERGVELLRYDGMDQDEKGVSRGKAAGMGPDIAWFADPSGNILSVLSD